MKQKSTIKAFPHAKAYKLPKNSSSSRQRGRAVRSARRAHNPQVGGSNPPLAIITREARKNKETVRFELDEPQLGVVQIHREKIHP